MGNDSLFLHRPFVVTRVLAVRFTPPATAFGPYVSEVYDRVYD